MRRIVQLILVILVLGSPVAASLFKVWVHHGVLAMGYKLSEERTRLQNLQATEEQLEVELAAERSPERMMRVARKLGLVAPAPEQVVGSLR
ncbi:MAG: hypothetical protein A2289_22445 [Deltaproteobacteria bacterium RIFOXYA12_FULL_58_15]|nr:MAG: hypothetical protein A2289_22445 [Deltaproteobacteria bacterium RIFOXYA12_FULL_58_15]OGR11769.1 MAG: hypothetical protein A2341_02470 [Deltaproteobacteria bacterium RIFOXYB12_FULL_58_9]